MTLALREVEESPPGEAMPRVTYVTLTARVAAYLARPGCARISQESLARRFNVTMRTMQRHLDDMVAIGVLSVDRESKPFTYSVRQDNAIDGVLLADVITVINGDIYDTAIASSEPE